jgi:hypothetical protein
MSAAKIPTIRARMRQQEILTFQITGSAEVSRAVRQPTRRASFGLWWRAGKAVRHLAWVIGATWGHRQTPSTTH